MDECGTSLPIGYSLGGHEQSRRDGEYIARGEASRVVADKRQPVHSVTVPPREAAMINLLPSSREAAFAC